MNTDNFDALMRKSSYILVRRLRTSTNHMGDILFRYSYIQPLPGPRCKTANHMLFYCFFYLVCACLYLCIVCRMGQRGILKTIVIVFYIRNELDIEYVRGQVRKGCG